MNESKFLLLLRRMGIYVYLKSIRRDIMDMEPVGAADQTKVPRGYFLGI